MMGLVINCVGSVFALKIKPICNRNNSLDWAKLAAWLSAIML